MKIVGVVFAMLLAIPALADVITVAYQDEGFQSVQMGNDPLLGPSYSWGGLGFDTTFSGVGTETFSASLDVGFFHMAWAPITFACNGVCEVQPTFVMPVFYAPTPGMLGISLNSVPDNYDLVYQSPAPEPASFLMLTTGLIVAWRKICRSCLI